MLMMRFLSALPIVSAYYTVPDLPETNLRAAMGNPLKGLIGGSRWSSVPLREDYINLSMESFSVGVCANESFCNCDSVADLLFTISLTGICPLNSCPKLWSGTTFLIGICLMA